MRLTTLLGVMIACLFMAAIPALQASEPPLVAHLDTLSAPVLGGTGQLIWAAMPNTTVKQAVLTFSLEEPGQGEPARTSQTLALQRGRLVEARYSFATPRAGLYRVSAQLRFAAGGQEFVSSRAAAFTVAAPGKTGAALRTTPPVTPLAIDGAPGSAELGQGADAWFSFTVTRQAVYTVLGVPANGISGVHLYLYGPDDPSAFITEELSIQGNPLFYYKLLAPGTYTLQVQSAKTTEAGTIALGVTTTALDLPSLTSLSIDGGAGSTFERQVTLNMTATGYPSEYMASESSSFAGASWQPYAASVPFTLSPAEGVKRVFVKVRDRSGAVSSVQSDTIVAQRMTPLTVNGGSVTGNIEAQRAVDWYVFDVTTESNYNIQTVALWLPDTYMRLYGPDSMNNLKAENDNWSYGGNHSSSSAQILAHLTPGTYYVKVQSSQSWNTGIYTIQVAASTGPILIDSCANGGIYDVYAKKVAITFNAIGNITDYRIGETESLYDAPWNPYGGTPRLLYTPSPGDGVKTVYLQLRDKTTGMLSGIVKSTFRVTVPRLLSLGQAMRGEITSETYRNAFQFTATVQGDYLVEVTPDAPGASGTWLKWISVSILGPNDFSKYEENDYIYDQSKGQFGLKALRSGAHVIGLGGWPQGKYTIRITQYTSTIPFVATLMIDLGNTLTTTRTVSLSSVIFGNAAKDYMASTRSDFSGASWQPYKSYDLRFDLPAGTGKKTIYFKVRDASGHESAVASDSIDYVEPQPLTVGAAAVTVYHGMNYPEVFEVTAPSAGKYIIETSPAATGSVDNLPMLDLIHWKYDGVFSGETRPDLRFPLFTLTVDGTGTFQINVSNVPSNPPAAGDKGYYQIRVYKDPKS